MLVYEDIEAAHDFLVRAFGLQAGRIDRDDEGRVVHGEVYTGNEAIWLHRVTSEHGLASPRSQDAPSGGLAVSVDDVDAHYERARAAGAHIDDQPTSPTAGASTGRETWRVTVGGSGPRSARQAVGRSGPPSAPIATLKPPP